MSYIPTAGLTSLCHTLTRGGGGFIRLVKIKDFNKSYIYQIIDNNLNGEISFKNAQFLLEDLCSKGFISKERAQTIMYAISDKALASPIKMEGLLRSNILKNVLVNILREGR